MYVLEVQRSNDTVIPPSITPIVDPYSSTSMIVIIYRGETLHRLWRAILLEPVLNSRNSFFSRSSSYITILVLLDTNIGYKDMFDMVWQAEFPSRDRHTVILRFAQRVQTSGTGHLI
jgi:hypothetical protein